ncbi:MAG: small subunit ribosomal protein S6e [Candidatus Woesearchaeota archaeon]|jgi:small subunit ribosomal protein S6e
MVKCKIVLGDKSGKTKQIEIEGDNANVFVGKKIGDSVKGESVDMPGYEFLITGGSDSAGFGMRRDVDMTGKRKILITKGTGLRKNREGRRVRKTVAGNTIGEDVSQVNLKVTKTGTTPLFEEPKTEEAPVDKKEEKTE